MSARIGGGDRQGLPGAECGGDPENYEGGKEK